MGLYKEDGTRIEQSAFPAVPASDTPMRLSEDVYETKAYGPGDGRPEGSRRHLLYQAGTVVPQSQTDRHFDPAATVTTITPTTGPAAGRTTITITGTRLDGVSAVNFGATPGTELKVISATELQVKTPAGAAGAVNVVVAADTGNVTKTGGFTYS
ncbi:IPT/TIG domain-containing protein [Streptomyces ferrugineus]|uniref:IPT/TIG domain-containing protein n=1 Tax=Streptomyces ferrugineus TaxID=1413221 RepID=A0A7M2SXD0_9ACTN|nr:IPT/TIG domain-containing protein [Streptomyces ferrugineus]QOV40158.1 IPT/TIG domain-containing protein [Streptomyces ferrugineus]